MLSTPLPWVTVPVFTVIAPLRKMPVLTPVSVRVMVSRSPVLVVMTAVIVCTVSGLVFLSPSMTCAYTGPLVV